MHSTAIQTTFGKNENTDMLGENIRPNEIEHKILDPNEPI